MELTNVDTRELRNKMIKQEKIKLEFEMENGEIFETITYGNKENFERYLEYCFKYKELVTIYSAATGREVYFPNEKIYCVSVEEL